MVKITKSRQLNENDPIGTPVCVVMDDGSTFHTKTRSEMWKLGHGEPVVKVEGITGCYIVERIWVHEF